MMKCPKKVNELFLKFFIFAVKELTIDKGFKVQKTFTRGKTILSDIPSENSFSESNLINP